MHSLVEYVRDESWQEDVGLRRDGVAVEDGLAAAAVAQPPAGTAAVRLQKKGGEGKVSWNFVKGV